MIQSLLAALLLLPTAAAAEPDAWIEDSIALPMGGGTRRRAPLQEKYEAMDPSGTPDETLISAQPPVPIQPQMIDPELAPNRRKPQDTQAGWNWKLNYFVGAQRSFVFPPSEVVFPNEENYFLGSAPGSSAAAARFAEYGADFAVRYDFRAPLFLQGRAFFHPFSIRPTPLDAVTQGWTIGGDFIVGLRVPMDNLGLFRLGTGSRTSFAAVERLPFANTFVQLWIFQAALEIWKVEILVEGGLGDMGSSTLSDFGVLRTAISKRARVSYKQPVGDVLKLVFGLEVQDLSRSYFGGTRLASMNAFNVNERSYLLMLGLEI
jgi:hypothetical protein